MSNKTSDKNVDSIKRLKQMVEMIPQCDFPKFQMDYDNSLLFANDLENILAERGQKDKRIKKLEEEKADWIRAYQEEKDSQFELLKRIKELESKNKYLESLSECQHDYLLNSIPTQKVIDKIEEIKNQISIDICIENNLEKHYELKYKIDVLQELIKGEK